MIIITFKIHSYMHCLFRELRAKKKRRKMLNEQNKSKDVDEKSNDKLLDKIKYETDEDSKDAVSVMDEESQGATSESKVIILKSMV